MAFIGDSKYIGDGGGELQRLWTSYQWREIRGCPGRYVSSSRALRLLKPEDLIDVLEIRGVTLQLYEVRGKDTIVIGRFRSGGGLLSYVKRMETTCSVAEAVKLQQLESASNSKVLPEAAVSVNAVVKGGSESKESVESDNTPIFVHTLNTESGLIRKVDAMLLDFDAGDRAANECWAVIRNILSFLHDSEKNNSAYSLVCRMIKR